MKPISELLSQIGAAYCKNLIHGYVIDELTNTLIIVFLDDFDSNVSYKLIEHLVTSWGASIERFEWKSPTHLKLHIPNILKHCIDSTGAALYCSTIDTSVC